MIRLTGGCPTQIVPWFSFSVPGAMHLMVLTLTAGAAFGCYLAAVITDPGACVHLALCRLYQSFGRYICGHQPDNDLQQRRPCAICCWCAASTASYGITLV